MQLKCDILDTISSDCSPRWSCYTTRIVDPQPAMLPTLWRWVGRAMVSMSDRLIVIFSFLKLADGKTLDKSAFAKKYASVQGIGVPGATNNINNWLSGTRPAPGADKAILASLQALYPSDRSAQISDLVTLPLSPIEFLSRCGVSYEVVKDLVSAEFRDGMKRGGLQVTSMMQMAEFAALNASASVRRFKEVQGRWTLYRHHSTEPGLLRETVLLKTVLNHHAEGTYYQYDPTSLGDAPFREVTVSFFLCGDTVTTFGCRTYDDGRKIDPIVASFLLRGYTAAPAPYERYVHFPGLLLALADSHGVPAAMRLVARQDSRDPTVPVGAAPVIRVTDQSELDLYSDAVKNTFGAGEYALLHSLTGMSAALNRGRETMQRRKDGNPPKVDEDEDGA